MSSIVNTAKRFGASYVWGVLNFAAGSIITAVMAYVAFAAMLKAKGLM